MRRPVRLRETSKRLQFRGPRVGGWSDHCSFRAAAVVAAAAMNQRELGVILRSYERWTLKLGAGCLRQMLA